MNTTTHTHHAAALESWHNFFRQSINATPEPLAATEARAPHWRTREEKMRMLDPLPELTLASERMEAAERLFRAALCLFGLCFGCLVLTSIIAAFALI